MSSVNSNNSKRVRQAIAGSDAAPVVPAADVVAPAANGDLPKTNATQQAATGDRASLALQRHRSHSMDNRPVDPSPIQVSHTVRLGGVRPIGVSNEPVEIDFSKAKNQAQPPHCPQHVGE
ncbi:MAG: hypothetical protein HC771_11655 [Synechococcales cyanobacterium CRU_2_2]|nr:hypothetical protein [Synechococcales cyanobacterium CRU_2_2]